MNNAASSWNRY